MNEIELVNLSFFKNKKKEIENEMKSINVYEIASEEDYEQALIDRKKLKDLIDKTERFRIDFNKEFTKQIKELYIPINEVLDKFEKRITAHKDWLEANKQLEIIEVLKELDSPLTVERMLEDDFFDKRYLNKSYKIEDIKKDLISKIEKVNRELEIIAIINDNPRLKELYLKHLNVKNAQDEFDLETKEVVPNVQELNEVQTYSLKIKTDKDTYDRIMSFIKVLGVEVELS